MNDLRRAQISPISSGLAKKNQLDELPTVLSHVPHLILLLDYDGTLVPIRPLPHLASPDPGLITLLNGLAKQQGVDVHIVSGRRRDDLAEWFRDCRVTLHAEHGIWLRCADTMEWSCREAFDHTTMNMLLRIAQDVTSMTPGSFIEEKTFGFTWHYRQCDPELGYQQSRILAKEILQMPCAERVRIIYGKKVIEVQPLTTSKGLVVEKIREESPEAVLLAVGDDRMDDEMFERLGGDDVSIQVGEFTSMAQFTLPDVNSVNKLLEDIRKKRKRNKNIYQLRSGSVRP